MDVQRLASFVPIISGAIIAIMWITVQGTVALFVTILVGALTGGFYAYLGSRDDGREDRPAPPAPG